MAIAKNTKLAGAQDVPITRKQNGVRYAPAAKRRVMYHAPIARKRQ